MNKRTQQYNNKQIQAVHDKFTRIGSSAQAKAFKIILLYFIIGCLWILLSDRMVELLFKNPESMVIASIAKGWLYVIVTSILFFSLIYGALRKEIQAKEKAEDINVNLQKSNILFSAILESSPEIIVFALDKQYHFIAFNHKQKEIVRELFGKTIEIGSNLLDVIENEENRESAKVVFDRALSGESFVLEEYLDTKLANLYMQNYYSPIRSENEIIGLTCFSLNITPLKSAEEENKYLSFHDKLTGLYNRRSCEEAILKMDNILNYPISIIIGDVNGLKLVNDSFGQQTGDELLQQAADAIIRVCRPMDIVARWGGDEFIILLPKTDAKEAEDIISM
ncbi:MAG: diguanylate cyclase, partial [Bacteroidota bacterium]|nr:diguanylate cyclase [Bacteroidota bacterium]